jgi:uncharacterized membrane protein YjgN (DUF898 family)
MTQNITINAGGPATPQAKIMEFDGSAADYLGTQILATLVTVCTLAICYPYALVLLERWRAKHTVLMGRRLYFKGTGIGLFGLWIKWFILIVITLGIYSFWVFPRITRWKVENTVYAA